MRRLLVLLPLLLAFGVAPPAHAAPPIEHVWTIVLENKDFADTFGPDTEAPFLARELTRSGQLLRNYFGTSHASLGNYLTMVSGQATNPLTQGDCPQFIDIFPGTPLPDGQTLGAGCVFPPHVETIADQLEAKGLRWKGYMEDMGTPCDHPAIGEIDETQVATPARQYATRHNPFVYFRSIIDDDASCKEHVVDLKQLLTDVQKPETTPNYAFITPDLCNDGHDPSCADGGLGGLPAADQFLKTWVPRILASPGFKTSGLLVITWDEANIAAGESSGACCDQPTGPNTPAPGLLGPGGGRTGTVLISPYIAAGTTNDTPYNHYGLLRSVQELFGLPPLGYSGRQGLETFGDDVWATGPQTPPTPGSGCRPATSGRPVNALRLRGDRLLTFRARRNARLTFRARLRDGKLVRVRGLRTVKACHRYGLKVPKGTQRVSVTGAGSTQRVRRGHSGEHDDKS